MKKIILSLFTLFSLSFSFGQNYLMLYNFDAVSQNLLVNPTNPSPYRLVIGVPGLSRLTFHLNNTVLTPGDILNESITEEDLKKIVDNVGDKERINAYEAVDLIYAGFKLKKGFLSFGVQQEASLNFAVPGQLLKFAYYGNGNDNGDLNITTKNFNAEALIRINYHVGYQHWLLDSTLIVGGRFKYISGTANAHFKNFDANVSSDIFEWKVSTDILLETSGYQYIEDFGSLNPLQLINSGNSGYGVDLGATYLLPKMKFSASVLNLGSIKWTQDLKHWQSKGDFTWEGVDVDENTEDVNFDNILDSLEAALGFKEITPYSYRTKLPMHIMASYEYNLTPKHSFALTYQGTNWNNNLYNNIGVNYIGRWAKRFNFILGYGRLSGGTNSFGAGFSAALGPVQLYLMSNNVWGAFKPTELSATNVRIGLNLVFFDKVDKVEKQKKEKKVKKEKSKKEEQ